MKAQSAKATFFFDQEQPILERGGSNMWKLKRWILIIILFSFILGCQSIKEMREAKESAERANKEAKVVLEKIREYAEKAEESAQRAERAAASAEDFSKKSEAASQKAVGSFERHLKK
jgi:predicted Holliday junction resolvase-like endonuclease